MAPGGSDAPAPAGGSALLSPGGLFARIRPLFFFQPPLALVLAHARSLQPKRFIQRAKRPQRVEGRPAADSRQRSACPERRERAGLGGAGLDESVGPATPNH